VAITVGLQQGLLQPLLRKGEWWSLPAALGILVAALFLWWLASRLYEGERRRIERKESSGRFGGWRATLPLLLAVTGFIVGLRPSLFAQTAILPLVIFGVLVFVMEQTLTTKRASFDLLDAREQALRAKLAPHFIFNTLNTLHAQIEQDPRGAQATTERLAQLFRQVIEASDRATIPLKQELAFVEAYLGIEQARLGKRLRVSVEVPEDLEAVNVLPLSLQVLVENAVKHGVAPLEQGGEVRIGAERKDGALCLWVEDPGPGLSELRGTGTALDTLRQRLERPQDLDMGLVDGRHRVSIQWRIA
jgi:signal transduction histidine kinase